VAPGFAHTTKADPVAAAAVERETNPALVAVARGAGLQVYAVDSVEYKAGRCRLAASEPVLKAPAYGSKAFDTLTSPL